MLAHVKFGRFRAVGMLGGASFAVGLKFRDLQVLKCTLTGEQTRINDKFCKEVRELE